MKTACVPGIALAVGIALAAVIAGHYTRPIPDVVLALLAGIVLNNTLRIPGLVRAGTKFVLHHVLRAAIVLLGAGLTFAEIAHLGLSTLALILACVVIAMSLGLGLAKLTRCPSKIGTLIGAGTAICGGTAILAIGPLITATEAEIAYAVTTIFTFNIVALLIYPLLGHALGMGSVAFGSWAGTAVNDTSVVVATGFEYGQAAGATATIVKLTRTLLLVPLAFGLASAYAARSRTNRTAKRVALGAMPWFVLCFAGMALLNSLHVFPADLSHGLTEISAFLIVVVLAGVGLNVDLARIRAMGLQPLAVGFALATTMAVLSFLLIQALHIG